MKKIIAVAVTIVMGVTLSACTMETKNITGDKPQELNSKGTKAEPQKQPTETPGETAPVKEQASKKELTKKIEVFVEGEKEMREATLSESTALGFQLYVLKGFSLESEEPGKDILISKYDGDFFARIEKLDEQTNISEYKNQQKAGFGQLGTVTELNPKELFHPVFQDAKVYLLTETGNLKDSSTKTNIVYLIKEFNGKLFAITLHMPLKEAAEGITPSLWAMLATLEA